MVVAARTRNLQRGRNARRGRVVAPGPPVAGYVAWYDASDAASIISSGGAVSQWNDKSGNGYHLTQASAGAKPTTGTRTINSLNAIDFDGTTDFVSSPNFTQAQGFTVIGVGKSDDPSVNRELWADSSGNYNLYVEGANYVMYAGSFVFAGTPDTASHVVCGVFNGGSSGIFVDGATIATGNAGTNAPAGAPFLVGAQNGGINLWDGLVAELLIYPSALSVGNRQAVQAYLKAKWGTP